MPLAFKTVEIAQIGAAACAAIAALASWTTVALSRRIWRSGQAPRLRGSAYRPAGAQGTVRVTMANAGRGLASEARFLLDAGGGLVMGRISESGFLEPSEERTISFSLSSNGRISGILYCVDSDDRWNVWTWDARRHRVTKRSIRSAPSINPRKEFRKLIGTEPPSEDSAIDWTR